MVVSDNGFPTVVGMYLVISRQLSDKTKLHYTQLCSFFCPLHKSAFWKLLDY